MEYKILNTIGEVYTDQARGLLAKVGVVDDFKGIQSELQERIGDYDIVVVGLGFRFDRQLLERATKLRLIVTATTGLDHIDLEYAKERSIEVISLRGETDFLDSITSTAELAVGLMIDLMRGISAGFESVKHYKWDRERFRGHVLYGKTLGVVGLGRLGKMMTRYGHAFGMEVVACDPRPDAEFCREQGVRVADLDTLLRQSDVVSIHVSLNPTTEHIFNTSAFSKMKPTAYLVNTARGQIVDERDLLVALTQGRIAGYAADVLADETHFNERFSNHPLVEYAKTHANVIIVPHIGGMTQESRAATDVFIAKKIMVWAERQGA